MKISAIALGLFLIAGTAFAVNEVTQNKVYSWRYKMTVEVETPEGVKIGSAVRQIGNDLHGSPLSQQGNPGDVSGEAVVVDLGERGVLFALISDKSDNRFSENFPLPGRIGGQGSTTPEGIKYQSSLPVGTKAVLNPRTPQGYPKLVTFTDMNDARSVTLVQEWERNQQAGKPFEQQRTLKSDRFEELFGAGVKLKSITIEITDEPKTKTGILEVLPKFDDEFWKWLKTLKYGDPRRVSGANFSRGSIAEFNRMKQGEKK